MNRIVEVYIVYIPILRVFLIQGGMSLFPLLSPLFDPGTNIMARQQIR